MTTQKGTILVIGATGKQGRAAIDHLLRGGWKVRGLTRDPEKPEAKALAAQGVDIRKGDLNEPRSVRGLMDGVYGVFCVLTFRERGPEGEMAQGKLIADMAKDANVRHFIYSSVGAANRMTGIPHF